jgi:ferredoxin
MGERTVARVDENRCVGSGDCSVVAPTAFEVDEDTGLARILPGGAQADPAQLLRAAHSCPTGAIELTQPS